MTGPPRNIRPHGWQACPFAKHPHTGTVRDSTRNGWTVGSVKLLPWRNALHSTFPQKGPGLWSPEQFLPDEEHGSHGYRSSRPHWPTGWVIRAQRELSGYRVSLTASTEPGYSGTAVLVTCAAGSGSVVYKREKRKSWKLPSCPGNPKDFSESIGFRLRRPRVQILTRLLCNPREIVSSGPQMLHL